MTISFFCLLNLIIRHFFNTLDLNVAHWKSNNFIFVFNIDIEQKHLLGFEFLLCHCKKQNKGIFITDFWELAGVVNRQLMFEIVILAAKSCYACWQQTHMMSNKHIVTTLEAAGGRWGGDDGDERTSTNKNAGQKKHWQAGGRFSLFS